MAAGGSASTAGGTSTAGGAAGGAVTSGGTTAGGTTAGGTASAGGSSAGGSATAGGSTAGGSAGACTPACARGRACCNGVCVNVENDPRNCGGCGTTCSGATPFCEGTCKAAPCSIDAGVCSSAQSCCGGACCGAGQLCCDAQGPVSGRQVCHTPTVAEPTCPQGCSPLCQSDRAIKSEVKPVNEREVLERVATLPLSTWRYTSDATTVRHLGPMAQDFHDAFGLGNTDTAYHSIDAHGVSLASIKALYQLMREQNARLERLEAENARLKAGLCQPTP